MDGDSNIATISITVLAPKAVHAVGSNDYGQLGSWGWIPSRTRP